MVSSVTGGASEVAAMKASQMHQATALVGVRAELKKDEETARNYIKNLR